MLDWNPDQYLKFAGERTQPSIDLASKIRVEEPGSVIDIGCGPGNSTEVLRSRWPNARLTGLDSSDDMIKKAKSDFSDIEWMKGDATTFDFKKEYDVVFSNAALQWMQDHETLIPRLYRIVKAGGALAVQVPADQDSPVRRSLLSVSSRDNWSGYTSGCDRLINYRTAEYYYDILAKVSSRFDLWESVYYHILDSPAAVIEWYKGTAMRPFLERLPDDENRKKFQEEVFAGCKDQYQVRRNGKVLYPFRRIFFVAYK